MRTLTEMLEMEVDDRQLLTPHTAKEVFKEWLKTVRLGTLTYTKEAAIQLLITLVDEPPL